MVLVGKGRFYYHQDGKLVLYVPAGVRNDSAFPFRPGEQARIEIDKGGLRVSKLPRGKRE